MIKFARFVGLMCVFSFGVSLLRANNLPVYHVGDVAAQEIVTPVPLDVVNPAATAALKTSEAAKVPAIFRFCAETNALANEFLAEFSGAHSNFIASLHETFQHTTLDEQTIASPDFGYLLTAFNVKNRNFPLTTKLASEWARGQSGFTERDELLNTLLPLMQLPITADDLPKGFIAGETLRLVPLNESREKLTLAEAETRGKLISESVLVTAAQVDIVFRRKFTGNDEQPLAHALAKLLKPNCIPDTNLTQLARERAVHQLIVAEHYDAGQTIIQQGGTVDAKIKLALEQLNEKMARQPMEKTPVKNDDALPKPAPILATANAVQIPAQKKVATPVSIHSDTPVQNHLTKNFAENNWPIFALGTGLMIILLIGVRLILRRRAVSPAARVTNLSVQKRATLSAELTPHLAQVVRETLVQELALQRHELLMAQQIATAEITTLVQRLDEMQMTMQERLLAYQTQIENLEKELAARSEENQELLKLKIEMTRQQLEMERERERVEFN